MSEYIERATFVIDAPVAVDQLHGIANVLLDIAASQGRQAVALERIADRLDSLTHVPTHGDFGERPDPGGPELRVRRW